MNPRTVKIDMNVTGGQPLEGAFTAGQTISTQALQQVITQASHVEATHMAAGLMSGAMSFLQAVIGTKATADICLRFLEQPSTADAPARAKGH